MLAVIATLQVFERVPPHNPLRHICRVMCRDTYPYGRAVFAFCNRRRDRIRLLFYDRSGFWLMMKRLEADRFAWPRGQQQAVVRLSTEQLHWLLDGIDIEAIRRHPARQYLSVG